MPIQSSQLCEVAAFCMGHVVAHKLLCSRKLSWSESWPHSFSFSQITQSFAACSHCQKALCIFCPVVYLLMEGRIVFILVTQHDQKSKLNIDFLRIKTRAVFRRTFVDFDYFLMVLHNCVSIHILNLKCPNFETQNSTKVSFNLVFLWR